MRGDEPRISIVVATLNAGTTLRRCLDSIGNQSYREWEIVLQDGGSVDGTLQIVKQYGCRIASWESRPDGGLYAAWNSALARVSGDWILFVGADDVLSDSDALRRVVPYLKDAPAPHGLVYAPIRKVTRHGTFLGVSGVPWAIASRNLWFGTPAPFPGSFHRRTLLEGLGGFREDFRIAGDYELMVREVKRTEPIFAPVDPVVDMVTGGMSTDPATAMLQEWEKLRVRRLHRHTRGLDGRFMRGVARASALVAAAHLFRRSPRYGKRGMAIAYRWVKGRDCPWWMTEDLNVDSAGSL